MSQKSIPFELRLWRNIIKGSADECWNWKANKRGQIRRGGAKTRPELAYRLVYELEVGEIPDGLFVLHTCDNGRCCNPSHLFLGTQKDNIDDMVKKGRQSRGKRHTGWQPVGENHPRAILTENDVRHIRKSYIPRHRKFGQCALARAHGVNQATIYAAIHNLTWSHVD